MSVGNRYVRRTDGAFALRWPRIHWSGPIGSELVCSLLWKTDDSSVRRLRANTRQKLRKSSRTAL
ncbi:hypothetical protein BRC68_02365 [Halobacteriales archaeon QH_6_64_20]|nr:MAG: hypothetical protein BRC68_02365 [Halobacteriales archaeon QH_6_64_20]